MMRKSKKASAPWTLMVHLHIVYAVLLLFVNVDIEFNDYVEEKKSDTSRTAAHLMLYANRPRYTKIKIYVPMELELYISNSLNRNNTNKPNKLDMKTAIFIER